MGCGAVARGTSEAFRWYRREPSAAGTRRTTAPGWCPAAQEFVVPPVVTRGVAGRPAGSIGGPAWAPRLPWTPWMHDPSSASLPRRPSTEGHVEPSDGHARVALPDDFDGRPGLPDRFGRALRDLRISVTDRCNFRCPYCMPAEVFGRDFAFLPREEVLSFEEIARLATIFVRARGPQAPDHRRRAARPPQPAGAHRLPRAAADRRRRAGRPHADDERLRAEGPRGAARARPGCSGSRSAWTRSTTRCSAR